MIAVKLENITKKFPLVLANDHVNLEVEEGEIHAIVGENGAGKSTLMKILYGYFQKDEGNIYIFGELIPVMTPHLAIEKGIGMVHQEFMLIPPLPVWENIVLGSEIKNGLFVDEKRCKEKIREIGRNMGFEVDLDAITGDLPVGVQQKIEIMKVLYRGAKILILDEPTAVLTPQEVEELFEILKRLKKEGKTILLITHKLNEVMAVSDKVTVMRKGKVIGTRITSQTTPEELAEMMVGRKIVLKVEKPQKEKGEEVIRVKNLRIKDPKKGVDVVKGVSFTVKKGEIVGIAGVAGNGQTELVEAISGLRKAEEGQVFLNEKEITNKTPYEIRMEGLAHIPEDRKGMGLIMEFSIGENIVIGRHTHPPFAKGIVLNKKAIRDRAKSLGEKFDIRPNSPPLKVKFLSGGNQQKVIIAREFDYNPAFLLASQPTRGLDVGAIEYVYKYLLKAREENKAILLISMELEEVLSLSDRILVMYNGEIVGEFDDSSKFDVQLIGRLMLQGREAETQYGK